MLQDLLLLLGLAYITYCGTLCAKHTLHIPGAVPAAAVGFPLGLGLFALTALLLQLFLSLPVSTAISLLLLRLFDIRHDWRRLRRHDISEPPPLEQPEQFGRFTIAMLSGSIIILLAFLHGQQLSTLPGDFSSAYPFTRSLLKGPISFNAPFYPNYPYTGNLYQAFLCASLSLPLNGDILRAAWILQSLALVSAVLLWALALRLFLNRALPAALSSVLLFFTLAAAGSGSSLTASSLIGLSACGALLLVYTNLIRQCKSHWKITPQAALLLGALTVWSWGLNPAAAFVICAAFIIIAAAYSLKRRSSAAVIGRSAAMLAASVLGWELTQGVRWQQLRLCHSQDLFLPQLPAPHFLAAASSSAVGQLQYVPLLSCAALQQHSLSLWLGLPLLIWAVRRRSLKGIFLFTGGAALYFLPGIIGFQTHGITPPQKWINASDGVFAILLGYAIGDLYQLWARNRSAFSAKLQRAALALVMLASISPLWPSAAAVWSDQPFRGRQIKYVCSPLYPSSRQWLADVPQLKLSPDEEEICGRLWQHNPHSCRTFFDLPDLELATVQHVAYLAGQAGCLPVGCSTMQESQQEDPFRPSAGAIAYLHCRQPELLLGLGTEMLITASDLPERADARCEVRQCAQVAAAPRSRTLRAYIIKGTFPWNSRFIPCPAPETSIELNGWPESSRQLAGGICYSAEARFNRSLRGWLLPMWYDGQNRWVCQDSQPSIYVEGTGRQIPVVLPGKEGKYRLSWLFYPADSPNPEGGKPLKLQRLAGSTTLEHRLSAALESSLRLVGTENNGAAEGTVILTNIAPHSLDIGSDLRLHWRIWSSETHCYSYYDKTEMSVLALPLPSGSTVRIPWRTGHALQASERLEFSVGVPYGAQYPITRK